MLNRLTQYFFAMRKASSLADQILVSGGNFLTIAICAHALPLAEQGKFTYVFVSYIAVLLLNIAGIFQGAAVRAPAQEKRSYRTTLARLQLLLAILLSILVCGIWLGAGNIFGWQITSTEACLFFAFLLLQQLADFDRRTAYIFASTRRAILSSALLYPVRVFGLIIFRPDTVNQVLLIMIFSAFFPAIITVIGACRNNRANAQPWLGEAKKQLTYSKLFLAGASLGWLWGYIPIFMLGIMHGKEQAALLGSIRGISNMANILMEQIETKVAADWARMHHGKGSQVLEEAVSRMLKIGVIFWLTGMIAVLLFGREIVNLILGGLYAPHWNLLVIGWIGYGIYFIARIYGIKHRTLGFNQIEFGGNLLGVIAAVLAGFVMIPVLSATGAAWVYVVIAIAIMVSQKYLAIRQE